MGQAETQSIASPVDFSPRRPRSSWAGLYIYGLAVLSLLVLGLIVYAQLHWPSLHPAGPFSWQSLLILMAAGLIAEANTTSVGSGAEASAGPLVFFLSFAVLGPLGGFIVAVVSQLLDLRHRQWLRTVCYTGTMGFLSGTTSLLYWALMSTAGGVAESSVPIVAAIGLGVGVFYHLLNFLLIVPVLWLRHGIGLKSTWLQVIRPFLPFALFFLTISLSLITVYQVYYAQRAAQSLPGTAGYSAWLVVVSLLPVFGLIYAFRAFAHQRSLAGNNARLAVRNERLALQAVASQITALDLKDDYTARHSAAVAQWASDIAKVMGLGDREQNLTHLASLLHDVGKIGIPDEVLKSPVKLDRVNWSLIEGHCFNGYRILKNIDEFDELATVVLHHHERFDGSGYPRGLRAQNIPLASRIICVADSYSAMVSDRPYGPALLPEIAVAELEIKRGTQFDPEVVDLFLRLLDSSDESYRRGEDADFLMEMQRVKFLQDLPAAQDQPEHHGATACPSTGRARATLRRWFAFLRDAPAAGSIQESQESRRTSS
jgi:HD-GYP domain-containing protein (c-di-GMP phosphodiesterase class II)